MSNGNQAPKATTNGNGAPAKAAGGMVMKGQRKAWHHLFKSDVRKMKKNVSFRKGQPKIEELDHTHVFHSINSQFKPQTITQISSGHFHEIEWKMVGNTPTVVKVGPPMKYGYVDTAAGQRRVKMPCSWATKLIDDNGERSKDITDTHTHQFAYVHTEELSEASVRSVQQDTAGVIANQMRDVGLQEGRTSGAE